MLVRLTPQQLYRLNNRSALNAKAKVTMARRRLEHPEEVRRTRKAWEDANREHVQSLWRDSYARHAERRRAYAVKWRSSNRSKSREMTRAWREANPEQTRAAIAAWRSTHREQVRALNHNYRARSHSASGHATAEQIEQRFAYYGNSCAYCGVLATAIDHAIPLSRGGSHWPANLYPACTSCNSSKKDKTPREFRAYLLVTKE